MTINKGDVEVPENKIRFNYSLLHPRYLASWLGLFLGLIVSCLPQQARHWLGAQVGLYLYKNNSKRRTIVRANLGQVFPDLPEDQLQSMVREHLNWYGKALVDYSLFFFGRRARLQKQVTIINEFLLTEVANQRQPVILFLAHSVMLEFAAVALSGNYKSFGSYKASSNPVLDWMIARSRCRFVDFVVSRDEGLRPLIRAIKSQRIMIFLPDEDLGLDNAVFAPFFGRQKATLTTPARLARMGSAKAIAGFVAFDDVSKQYQLRLQAMPAAYPDGESGVDASALNQALERLIAQSPEQYLWVMKWYKTYTSPDKGIY